MAGRKRVFLAGANGMVGKNILENPKSKSYEWLIPSRKDLDLRDRKSVQDYFRATQPEFVINAAGVVGGIQANVREPVRFFTDNLDIGVNLITAAKETGIRKFLNLSCSCMFPRVAALPMREESILTGELEPTNEGYAIARIAAQRLCEYVSRESSGYLYKTLIACNLYGRHDKFDPRHAHMIPAVMVKLHDAALSRSPEVSIWGDGSATREFMFAGDFAECVLRSIEEFETLPDVCNVGPGEEVSIKEYYEKIARVVGYEGSFVFDLSKPSGMARKVVDISKITAWGWRASTSLEAGLKQTYEFYQGAL